MFQNKTILFLVFLIGVISSFVVLKKLRYEDKTEETKKYNFVTDISYYYFTSHESKISFSSDFLDKKIVEKIPLILGDWVGEDIRHDFPHLLHYRLYKNKKTNDELWFISVYGTHESQFHTAEVCYIADGWDVYERSIQELKLGEDTFRLRYTKALMGKTTHLSAYFYLWKNSQRRMKDGVTMFRVSVVMKDSESKAHEALLNFIHNLKIY
ncbi:MAG: exosortase-associated EpsI family protein [Deltaproteobacteria bacterium]|nr:exosortase-associated EpsI family protein [Deltaproteobacteria bacterium]